MDTLQALITGIVQGFTEFLPVSSSGHIVFTSSIYKILTGKELACGGSEEIFFDIMIHVGTLAAVLIYFKQDIINLFNIFMKSWKDGTLKTNEEAKIPVYIALGTIATVFTAFPFKSYIETLVYTPAVVGIVLMITGILLFSTEIIAEKTTQKDSFIGWKRALLIGIAQGLAVVPGLSRSGTTIAIGLALGLDRVICARYSFLLSIPIILLVAIFHSFELALIGELGNFNWSAIIAGTLLSGLVGYFCIKYFIIFISGNKLNGFAAYCLIIGLSMAIFFGTHGTV